MFRNYKKGFTLIELLVVIAIIGILSSVVLASLNTARERGADAAIRSTINSTRAEAELWYDGQTPNAYTGLCAELTAAATAVNNAGGAGSWVCNPPLAATVADAYAISGQLSDGSYYCVDSTGAAVETATALGVATQCP
jgi:prepilin-type N-terminal cleavage/methylation domain-containing protein